MWDFYWENSASTPWGGQVRSWTTVSQPWLHIHHIITAPIFPKHLDRWFDPRLIDTKTVHHIFLSRWSLNSRTIGQANSTSSQLEITLYKKHSHLHTAHACFLFRKVHLNGYNRNMGCKIPKCATCPDLWLRILFIPTASGSAELQDALASWICLLSVGSIILFSLIVCFCLFYCRH